MESSSWPESLRSNRIKAIQELTQGRTLINKLQQMLDKPEKIKSDVKSIDDTLVQIMGMFNKTLSIMNSSSTKFKEIPQNQTHNTSSPNNWDDQKSEYSMENVKSVIPIKTKRGCYKRRKSSSIFTKVTSTLIDDGYVWRKYGEKVIINSKYRRHYYRCTHKYDQRCQATKQVQKTDNEPPMYKTTYHGHHTCKNLQTASQINVGDDSVLLSFETNTIIKTKQVGPLSSSTKRKPHEGFRCLSVEHENVSSSSYSTTWDPVSQSSQMLEPKPIMSSGLDNEDMVSSGVFLSTCSNDFGDLLSEICFANS